MSAREIDDYLAQLAEPKRSPLKQLRQTILAVVPDAEEELSYGVPAFRIRGKTVAGFSAAKNHLSYLPRSGEVLGQLTAEDLAGFEASKGAFAISTSLRHLGVGRLRTRSPDNNRRGGALECDQ